MLSKLKRYLPNIGGLFFLLLLVSTLSRFCPQERISAGMWIAIYLVWAWCAIFIWKKADSTKYSSAHLCLLSIFFGIFWYILSRSFAYLVFGENEPESSKIYDLLIFLMITPGLTFIFFAGWIRNKIKS